MTNHTDLGELVGKASGGTFRARNTNIPLLLEFTLGDNFPFS